MRYGDTAYYCKKKETPNGIVEFDEPQALKLVVGRASIQPATGYSALQEFGINISKYQIAILQPYKKYENEFKNGDVFYLDGVKPNNELEETYGELANYVVEDVSKQNLGIRLTLKRI